MLGPSGTAEWARPYLHLGVRTDGDPNGYLDPLQFLPIRSAPAAPPSPVAGGAPPAPARHTAPARPPLPTPPPRQAPPAEPDPSALSEPAALTVTSVPAVRASARPSRVSGPIEPALDIARAPYTAVPLPHA